MLSLCKYLITTKSTFILLPFQICEWFSKLALRCFSSDVAEQYFQESMSSLKDAKGTGKAKLLSIQDEYCHFLQVTGQEEVSE